MEDKAEESTEVQELGEYIHTTNKYRGTTTQPRGISRSMQTDLDDVFSSPKKANIHPKILSLLLNEHFALWQHRCKTKAMLL